MKLRALLISFAVVLGMSAATLAPTAMQAAPASAASTSYLWNYHGHTVMINPYAPNYSGSVRLEKNGTGVIMKCYRDGVSFTGNYKSTRWFWLQIFSYSGLRYYGWAHSSYVQNQKSVGRC